MFYLSISYKKLLSYFTLSFYSMRLCFLFSMNHEGTGIIHFFFFYRYLENWETIVNYDKSLFISTGQKDK